MDQHTEQVFPPLDREAELDRIAAGCSSASGTGMQLLNLVGAQAENLIDMLPEAVRGGLERPRPWRWSRPSRWPPGRGDGCAMPPTG